MAEPIIEEVPGSDPDLAAALAELGVADAYLLTTAIHALALRLGFNRLDRADAPVAIRQSRQFARLCPSSAALFHRSLP